VIILFASLPLWQANKAAGGGSAPDGTAHKFTDMLRIPGVKAVLAGFFCYCTIESTVGLWGASFLVMSKGITPEIAARWVSLYYIGITFGRFLSGFVTFKLNSRQMIRLGQAIILLGVIVILLPLGNAVLLPGFFMIGLGCAPIYPSLIHETPRNFGEDNSQAVIGMQMASAYVGTTLMPPLFGWIASFTGFVIFPFVVGAVLVLQFAAVEMLNKSAGKGKGNAKS
jgi:fucose permease